VVEWGQNFEFGRVINMSQVIFEYLVSSVNKDIWFPQFNWAFDICAKKDISNILIIGIRDDIEQVDKMLYKMNPDLLIERFDILKEKKEKNYSKITKFIRLPLTLPFSEGSFDLIIVLFSKSIEKWEYFESRNLGSFFAEDARILRANGTLFFAVKKWEGKPSILKQLKFFLIRRLNIRYCWKLAYADQRIKTNGKSNIQLNNSKLLQVFRVIDKSLGKYLFEAGFKSASVEIILPYLETPYVCVPYDSLYALPYALNFILGGSKWIFLLQLIKFIFKIFRFLPKETCKKIISGSIPGVHVTVLKSEISEEKNFGDKALNIMQQLDPTIVSLFRVGTLEKIIYVGVNIWGIPKRILKLLHPIYQDNQYNNPVANMSGVYREIRIIMGKTAIIEPLVKGKPVSFLNINHRDKILQWLMELHEYNNEGIWDLEKAQIYIKEAINVIDKFEKYENKHFKEYVINISDRFLGNYKKWIGKIHIVPEHGDFVPSNILIDKNNQLKIIDCEGYIEKGCSLFDITCFLYASAEGEPRKIDLDLFRKTLIKKSNLSKAFTNLTLEICKIYGITEDIFIDFSAIALARKVEISLQQGKKDIAQMWLSLLEIFTDVMINKR